MNLTQQMRDFLFLLFSGQNFMPRLQCGTWTPILLRCYVTADLTIAAAYFAIPICIWWAWRRYGRSAPLPTEAKILCLLFGTFIVACGCTHLVDCFIFIHPLYRLQTLTLTLTALCSVMTAAVAPRMMHRLGGAQKTLKDQQDSIDKYQSDVESLNAELSTAKRFVEEYIKKHPDSAGGSAGNGRE